MTIVPVQNLGEYLLPACLDVSRQEYLDPNSMQNNGLYGYHYGFRAIILHTFGV